MSSSATELHDKEDLVFRYDMFISHTAQDGDWVTSRLLPELEKQRIEFCSARDFEPGTPKIEAIQYAIEASRSTLFVISPEYLANEWSQFESQLSFHAYLGVRSDPVKTSTALGDTLSRARRNRRTIPLLLEPCQLPLWFDSLVCLDLTEPASQPAELERLVRTIFALRQAPSLSPQPRAEKEAWTDEAARSLAWEIHHVLPTKAYREFVARYLLHLDPEQLPIDPFARDLPVAVREAAYVERRDVEAEVVQRGSQIIAGPVGAGKTALAEYLSRSLSPRYLVVRCSLDGGTRAAAPGNDETSASAHSVELISRQVFGAYTERLLGSPVGQPSALPRSRRKQDWMEHLRWLNRVFRPAWVAPAFDFELMDWLENAPRFQNLPAPRDAFPDLISFLSHPTSIDGISGAERQYDGILLLLDTPSNLPSHAADEIACLAQLLAGMDPGHLQLKLFASDGGAAEIVRRLDAAGSGHLALYRLPRWREAELRELLAKRLLVGMPGEYELHDWAELLPETSLRPSARRKLVDIIVAGALRAYKSGRIDEDSGLDLNAEVASSTDAPLHALALARGLVAACAGCLGRHDGATANDQQPLDIAQLEALVEYYWTSS